jgi:hypothetical protein
MNHPSMEDQKDRRGEESQERFEVTSDGAISFTLIGFRGSNAHITHVWKWCLSLLSKLLYSVRLKMRMYLSVKRSS